MERMSVSTHSTAQKLPNIISAEFLATLRAYGVIKAQIFGSTARGTDRPDSDVDLLVAFDRPVTLFQQMDLADELSPRCGRTVDVMTAIDPAFAPYIIPTLVTLPLE
jgi:predicted nucleotidyltransferase